MKRRLKAFVVSICLCAAHVPSFASTSATGQQAQAPNLSRQQRELLLAIVNAVDAAQAQPGHDELPWKIHLMRASDGSHYVAFSLVPPASSPLPEGSAMLYVRLATSNALAAQKITERSAVKEWLAGNRTDPRLLPRRGIVIGEMPIMGATSSMGSTRQPISSGANDMRLMALERERAKKEQEERDKQRRAELEGKATTTRDVLPFEDFDLASRSALDDGTRVVTRAFTAGPGEYDLVVAWADPAAPKAASTIRVLRRTLQLPPATAAGLTAGSIILADRVALRPAPYPPSEQAAHPYSIGLMDIVPARDSVFTRDEALSVAFQVINARPSEAGMPDVGVGFRIVRLNGERETQVASLNPQYYNATTLPPGFDLRQGHPIFAAVSAPLATLARGQYRLKVLVNDRLAGASATADADFTIAGTPASLLAEAPPLARPFNREIALDARNLSVVLDTLAPSSPSPQLARAISVARNGKLIDLLIEEPVPAAEAGIRTALTALALISVADTSAAVQLQRALLQNAPAGPVHYLTGVARALQNRDPDAISAWQAALDAGNAPPSTRQLTVEALLRRGDTARASSMVAGVEATDPAWIRLAASTHIAAGRYAEAAKTLEPHLAAAPGDLDGRWLLVHALFAEALKGADRDRFVVEARTYVESRGRHADLAAEWLRVLQ